MTVSSEAGAPDAAGAAIAEGAERADHDTKRRVRRIVLLGNPNTGKTTLFNALTGLRHKTSNFPGTTQEARVGHIRAASGAAHDAAEVTLIDLPGVYSLGLAMGEAAICRDALRGAIALPGAPPERHAGAEAGERPDAALVVVDATNLAANLPLVGEALATGVRVLVVVNMMDCAAKEGIEIDAPALARALGCPVVPVCARSGAGLERLIEAVFLALDDDRPRADRAEGSDTAIGAIAPPHGVDALGGWATRIASRAATRREPALLDRAHARTDRVDRVLTHPALGAVCFALVMTGLFWAIFSLAQLPMGWIDGVFASLASWVRVALPGGFVRDLLADGVVAGVGATLVFIPQICLLFFLISLLEDSGYLARAAFVADRLLRPFGLSGHSFVPLLSSHACALPGIMACRGVPDARERLAAILVAPFMSCTARMPVYVLLVTVLFPGRPMAQALAFTGCYVLGAAAGMLSAVVARRTVARGATHPMALELPAYRAPSVKGAAIAAYDRGLVFIKKAGTNILAICVLLWWLGAFPRVAPPLEAGALRESAALVAPTDEAGALALRAEADHMEAIHQARRSWVGRLGSAIEPVVRPLGWDRQLAVGVLASFAAREVFVSTMAVVTSGEDDADAARTTERLASAKRDDGVTPVFTAAASWSLLVYYVLAMQCLPTLAVTAREAGGVKWALLQLAWMSALAYGAGFIAFRIATALGV